MKSRAVSATKLILEEVLETGGMFWDALFVGYSSKAFYKALSDPREWQYEKVNKKLDNSFRYLKRNNLIKYQYHGKQLYISITPKGRGLAKKYQINDLKIESTKPWDKKWRVLFFDIQTSQKVKREALRGKLKELDFFQLQKSVWVCPYKCQKEIDVLRDFFDLDKNELILIVTNNIDNDQLIKRYFSLS